MKKVFLLMLRLGEHSSRGQCGKLSKKRPGVNPSGHLVSLSKTN